LRGYEKARRKIIPREITFHPAKAGRGGLMILSQRCLAENGTGRRLSVEESFTRLVFWRRYLEALIRVPAAAPV